MLLFGTNQRTASLTGLQLGCNRKGCVRVTDEPNCIRRYTESETITKPLNENVVYCFLLCSATS